MAGRGKAYRPGRASIRATQKSRSCLGVEDKRGTVTVDVLVAAPLEVMLAELLVS